MITILLFAHLRDQAGQRELKLEAGMMTVADLKKLLEEQYSLDTKSVMVAINEEFAADTDHVEAGDTVAFIPPVSGG